MTDFHTLLKQSIVERGIDDPADREEVYAQARLAMIRKLWSYDPPLREDDIHARIDAFDAAVEVIEAELVETFGGGVAASTGRRSAVAGYIEDADAPGDEALPAREPYRPMPPRTGAAWSRTAFDPADDDPAPAQGYDDEAEYNRASPDDDFDPAYGDDSYAYADDDHDDPLPEGRSRTYDDDDDDGDDEAIGAYVDDDGDEPRRRLPHDRWTEPAGRPPPAAAAAAARQRQIGLSDRDKVRVLAGAIGLLAVVLVGFGAYLLIPGGADEVTVGIADRREVSDAATAVRLAAEDLNVVQSFTLFDGRDPTVFQAAPDNPIRFTGDGDQGFARISSSTGATGARALVGPGLASRLAGKRVRVTLVARSSQERGAANMRFAYQSGIALSHWQTANLGPGYEAVALIWPVPALQTSDTGQYLLIEPGIPGDGTGVDISAIRIDVLASPEA